MVISGAAERRRSRPAVRLRRHPGSGYRSGNGPWSARLAGDRQCRRTARQRRRPVGTEVRAVAMIDFGGAGRTVEKRMLIDSFVPRHAIPPRPRATQDLLMPPDTLTPAVVLLLIHVNVRPAPSH